MLTVNVHEAKTQLSRLLARVEAGEEVVIARRGAPVAWLVACKRQPDVLKGRIAITDAFFEPLPEDELKLWEGGCSLARTAFRTTEVKARMSSVRVAPLEVETVETGTEPRVAVLGSTWDGSPPEPRRERQPLNPPGGAAS